MKFRKCDATTNFLAHNAGNLFCDSTSNIPDAVQFLARKINSNEEALNALETNGLNDKTLLE